MLIVPVTGMAVTQIVLLYCTKLFTLETSGELYLRILEFLLSLDWEIQPDLFFSLNLSLVLLIPLFLILKYVRTETIPYEKEPALHIIARMILYGFIIAVDFILLSEKDLIIVPGIYFVTLAVKFYEQYSLEALGFHAQKLLKNVGTGILITIGLEAPLLVYIFFGKTVMPIDMRMMVIFFFATLSFTLPNALWEELVWRGYLQTKVGKLRNVGTGILFQAVLCGVFHLILRETSDIVYFFSLFLFAVVWGYTRYRAQSLVPSTVSHTLWNGTVGPINRQLKKSFLWHDRVGCLLFQTAIIVIALLLYEYRIRKKYQNR